MKLHLYQNRHLFADDDLIGKYDSITKSVRLFEKFEALVDDARNFFLRTQGMMIKVLLWSDPVLPGPLKDYPYEVACLAEPGLEDLTPALVEHARKHWTIAEFTARYQGRAEFREETAPTAKPAKAGKTLATADA